MRHLLYMEFRQFEVFLNDEKIFLGLSFFQGSKLRHPLYYYLDLRELR